MSQIKEFVEYLELSRNIVVLTGAGMSTDSGIPDFRSPTGLWSKYDPNEYATIDAFYHDPQKVWRFFGELYESLKNAKPNQGHYYLARIEQWKRESNPDSSFVVITQNIDGFHHLAGSTDVIELHGDARKAECLSCGELYEMEEILKNLDNENPPCCQKCSGLLKESVVMFGEPLPISAYNRARQVSEMSDLFIVLGSSLVVSPANLLVLEAPGRKVIVNLEETIYDSAFDLVFHDRITNVLGQVVKLLEL